MDIKLHISEKATDDHDIYVKLKLEGKKNDVRDMILKLADDF